MKTIIKISLFLALVTITATTPVLADGPGPVPTCPTYPNCIAGPTGHQL